MLVLSVRPTPPLSPCSAWVDPLLSRDTALSGWLPLRTTVKEHLHARATDLPVFWGHGRSDQVVAYDCPSPFLPPPSFPSPPSQNQLTPFNLVVGRRQTLNRIPCLRARTGKGRRLARQRGEVRILRWTGAWQQSSGTGASQELVRLSPSSHLSPTCSHPSFADECFSLCVI